MKLNGAYLLIVHAHGANITGGSIHIIRKNKEVLVVASKEIGLEVNADTTKYMVMSRDQYTGRNQNKSIDISSVKRWNYLNIWQQP